MRNTVKLLKLLDKKDDEMVLQNQIRDEYRDRRFNYDEYSNRQVGDTKRKLTYSQERVKKIWQNFYKLKASLNPDEMTEWQEIENKRNARKKGQPTQPKPVALEDRTKELVEGIYSLTARYLDKQDELNMLKNFSKDFEKADPDYYDKISFEAQTAFKAIEREIIRLVRELAAEKRRLKSPEYLQLIKELQAIEDKANDQVDELNIMILETISQGNELKRIDRDQRALVMKYKGDESDLLDQENLDWPDRLRASLMVWFVEFRQNLKPDEIIQDIDPEYYPKRVRIQAKEFIELYS